VEDVVFSALASAQVVLTQHQKDLGALVIDMGGGTTDYILYNDGAVKQSGALAVGGDHITNDISMGLRIPMARAEKLKVDEGSVVLGNCLPGETILLKDDSGFAGKEIERETLNTVIYLRVREIFELLKRTLDEESYINYTGAGVSAFENPQFSTAIGLLKYAQAVQTDRPRRGIGRLFGRLFSGMR
jgi:cell division protein FtsA